MIELLPVYVGLAVAFAACGAVVLGSDPPWELRNVPVEGRVVLAILAAAFWPLFALAGILWVLIAFGRGVGQVWRLAFSRGAPPSELPTARQVRR